MRKVLILGSTGSIGTQALDVIERNNELIVVGLSAGSDHVGLLDQAQRHRVDSIALASPDAAALASEQWDEGTVFSGIDGIIRLIIETECDKIGRAHV